MEHIDTVLTHILDTFNSVNPNISFTLKANGPNNWLPFLDIKVKIENGNIKYSWYQKEFHSKITLRTDSFVPQHVKNNFVNKRYIDIQTRCSDENLRQTSEGKLFDILKQNGYTKKDVKKLINNRQNQNKQNNNAKNSILKLPFISDRCNREINKLIKRYNLPVRLLMNMVANEQVCGLTKKVLKNCNCEICSGLEKYSCRDRFIVYKYTCNLCDEFYIGKTARQFIIRHQEHQRSIKNKNSLSVLSENT